MGNGYEATGSVAPVEPPDARACGRGQHCQGVFGEEVHTHLTRQGEWMRANNG